MTSETLDWLSKKAPRFAALAKEDQEQFSDFLVLWSLFEGTELSKKGSVAKIREYVDRLECSGKIHGVNVDTYLGYLRARYINNGTFTQFYADLHLDINGNPPEVPEAMKNPNALKTVLLTGCLIIIYRLRNNLFHGEKWQYELVGDRDNFFHANTFLKQLMSLEDNV